MRCRHRAGHINSSLPSVRDLAFAADRRKTSLDGLRWTRTAPAYPYHTPARVWRTNSRHGFPCTGAAWRRLIARGWRLRRMARMRTRKTRLHSGAKPAAAAAAARHLRCSLSRLAPSCGALPVMKVRHLCGRRSKRVAAFGVQQARASGGWRGGGAARAAMSSRTAKVPFWVVTVSLPARSACVVLYGYSPRLSCAPPFPPVAAVCSTACTAYGATISGALAGLFLHPLAGRTTCPPSLLPGTTAYHALPALLCLPAFSATRC